MLFKKYPFLRIFFLGIVLQFIAINVYNGCYLDINQKIKIHNIGDFEGDDFEEFELSESDDMFFMEEIFNYIISKNPSFEIDKYLSESKNYFHSSLVLLIFHSEIPIPPPDFIK